MNAPVRNSIRVLLLNDKNELLLMCADDPKTYKMGGEYRGCFWFPIGGKIENSETIEEAAIREIYEETGIKQHEIEFGPIVWFEELDLILSGTLTHLSQKFIVANTKNSNITLANLTPDEQKVIQNIAWFSFEKIKTWPEIIYPVSLKQYIPDIMAGVYPPKPIELHLAN